MKNLKRLLLIIGACCVVINISAQDNYDEQILQQPIIGTSNYFGNTVSIDGDYAVVGSPGENNQTGAAHVFKRNADGNWIHIQKITAFIGQSVDEYFGTTVHIQGNYIFISSPTDRLNEAAFELPAGSVMIYKNDGNDNFVGIQRIRSSDISVGDYFGDSIDSYGDFLVVGASHEDHDVDGNNTLSSSGSAYVFKKNAVNDQWSQIQKLVPSHRKAFDSTGYSLAIYQDYIILGSGNNTDADDANPINGSGSVFIFKKDALNDVWVETQKLKGDANANTNFGGSGLDVNGSYIAVGARGEENVYMFKLNNGDGIWERTQKINAIGFSTSGFGSNLDVDGDFFIASAPNAAVQNPDGTNTASGTVFIFKNNNDTWNQIGQVRPSDGEINDLYGGGDTSFPFYSNSVIDFDGIHFIVGAGFNDVTDGGNTFVNAGKAYISGNFTGLFNQTFTWTGAVSTDWNTAGNWDLNAVPTAIDDVIIADVGNNPRINFNQSHTVNNLTTHKTLTIKNNASLTVNGNLDQRATIQVESFVTGNGSFILKGNQLNPNPPDVTYLRYVSGNNWHLISSPVKEVAIDAFATATPLAEGQGNNRGIGFYDNNANPNWSYYQNGANDTGNFTEGRGYSLRTSANAFLIFTGKLKADNLTNHQITQNLTGWNLVGNPYPAHINANVNADANNNFLTENADQLDPAFANIYLWNPTTNSYDPIGNGLAAKYITPGQGFFIRAKNGGGAININKTMQTHQIGEVFLKQSEPTKIEINLNSNSKTSKSTIVFKEDMTLGLDVTFDAAVFDGATNNHYVYSKLVDDSSELPFATQFLPEIGSEQIIIPLGVKNDDDNNLSFSFDVNIPNYISIVLEDRKQNTFTPIQSNTLYNFDYVTSDELNRFFIHIQNQTLSINTIHQKKINIYKNTDNSILVNGVVNGTLSMYTIRGKVIVKNKKINNNHQEVNIPKISRGVYIFEILTDDLRMMKKMIF